MIHLFRWLHEHASIFRDTTWEQSGARTMRREVTVQKEERTLVVGTGFPQSSVVCPFCGQKLPEEGAGNWTAQNGDRPRLDR